MSDYDDDGPAWDGWPRELLGHLSFVGSTLFSAVAPGTCLLACGAPLENMLICAATSMAAGLVVSCPIFCLIRDRYRTRAAAHAAWLAARPTPPR